MHLLATVAVLGRRPHGWFLSFAIANYAGGLIATLTGGHGGGEVAAADLSELEMKTAGLSQYIDVFSTLGFVLVGFAVLIAVMNKPLNKLMHGVR